MNTINKNDRLPASAQNSNLLFLNEKAQAWHAQYQAVKAAVDKPLWEVFCAPLLMEKVCILTEEAKVVVQKRAHVLGLDFYARPLHADEVTVRLSGLPMTTEDVQFMLDL